MAPKVVVVVPFSVVLTFFVGQAAFAIGVALSFLLAICCGAIVGAVIAGAAGRDPASGAKTVGTMALFSLLFAFVFAVLGVVFVFLGEFIAHMRDVDSFEDKLPGTVNAIKIWAGIGALIGASIPLYSAISGDGDF